MLLLGHENKTEKEGEIRAKKFNPVVQELSGFKVIGLGSLYRIQ
jgi:hypothetical protein